MQGGESSMGGSENGDETPQNLNKSGHRISSREKRVVNYGQMAQGTGDVSAAMDYGEVSR